MRQRCRWTRSPESVEQAWASEFAPIGQDAPILVMLTPPANDLYDRFAIYYDRLRNLPRRVRRVSCKKAKVSLAGAALLLALGQEPALAATLTAGNAAELIAAINQANDEIGNTGPDTIELTDDIVLTVADNTQYEATGLPVISSAITIEGHEHTVQRDSEAAEFRLVAVDNTGDLTLKETTLSGGVARYLGPGTQRDGGALFNGGGVVTVIDSTISGNSSDGSGGGIKSFGGELNVRYSLVISNLAKSGGGIQNTLGTVSIENSTVVGNSASQYLPSGSRYIGYGGGLRNDFGSINISNSQISQNFAAGQGGGVWADDGEITIADSIVSGNSTGDHGGGLASSGNVTITNTTFSSNLAGFRGGAIRTVEGTVVIRNSTIVGNSSYGGGGVNSTSRSLEISNSTLVSNSAHYGGAGVLCCNIEVNEIINSTLSGNTADDTGGGLFVIAQPEVNVRNTIITGNSAEIGGDNCMGLINSLGHNLSDDETCNPNGITDKTPATFSALQVRLGAFVDKGPGRGHLPLLPRSSAIDMGDPATCPPNDQLGNSRIGICDIGAVEFVAATITPAGALDVEANGSPDALTDGILILRFLFGFSGDPLIAGGVVDPGCTRCTAEEMRQFLDGVLLDVDGNGISDALTDGILVRRFLFGFRGDALTDGEVVASDCTRCTAEEIETFLEPGKGP